MALLIKIMSGKHAQPDSIGPYKIVLSLGKGGMGEVFLAKDSSCHRLVAVKQIRQDLLQYKVMQDRFLREAFIAAQLTHPSIISIFSIHQEKDSIYYTMPYIEGETLRQILRLTREQEKRGEELHPIGGSIPTLMRIFLNICQAIAYCHSKGILHRDLKPENIIVGKFGEVLLLDWGLADFIEHPTELEEIEDILPAVASDLTRPGKIVGTLSYMAPERALSEPSSRSTDIYALGVILYQLLTLRLPFHRDTIAQFRKHMKHEELIDPIAAAPYRDIPHELQDIAKRCLAFSPQDRYKSVNEIIDDLERYIEGRPQWMPVATLHIEKKEDWEFQANILLAKHIAITRGTALMEWVGVMISKLSFSGNTKLEAEICLGEQSSGVGFLLSIPDAGIRKGIEDGYCLWIGSEKHPACQLFRSNIEVMNLPDVSLSPQKWHKIRIEKIDNHLRFFLDDMLKLNYLSHTPLYGNHVGLLCRDADFKIRAFQAYVSSQNVMVNCLSVPDALLANRDYAKALSEYRRIGYSFPGRAEGREALFRAGITLLEEAVHQKKTRKKQQLLMLANEEFGKLRSTPGAPLEYLGKSLVYKATKDIEEEIKCLELALRKYPKHPLLSILVEHIVFRLHETSYFSRLAAYHFALLALRHLPSIFSNPDHVRLIESLEKYWETLPFIYAQKEYSSLFAKNSHRSLQLAFWLAKPITLVEILESIPASLPERPLLIGNALFALLELGCYDWVKDNLPEAPLLQQALKMALSCHEKPLKEVVEDKQWLEPSLDPRALFHLFETALNEEKPLLVLPLFSSIFKRQWTKQEQRHLNVLSIWALLLAKKWNEAKEAFDQLGKNAPFDSSTPFFFLYGCFLAATEGKAAALSHFKEMPESVTPPTHQLLSAYLLGKIDLKRRWAAAAFHWEKIQLYRQLYLFYHCSKQPQKAKLILKRLKRELNRVKFLYAST